MNIVNLTPFFRTVDREFEIQKIIYRKNKAFESWLKRNLAPDIKGQYSFSDVGESCLRCFIYLNPKDEQSAINVLKWIKWLKGKRFKVEKFWREDQGYFAYKIERTYGKYGSMQYIIFIEHAANLDGCEIKKKRKMKTIYVTNCETERVML